MKPGVLFFVLADVKDYLVVNGMLKDDGTAIFTDLTKDVALAAVVENSLKRHGVVVQSQVDQVILALPLVISIFVH